MFYKNNDKALYSAAVVFAATLALNVAPLWAQVSRGSGDNQAQEDEEVVTVVPANYCHTKFRPAENDSGEGVQLGNAPDDWIDYSGPCDKQSMEDAEKQLRETSTDD